MTVLIAKLAGVAILLTSSIIFGQSKIKAEKEKIKLTSALADMVKHIGERIEHFSQPLPEIFSEYRNTYLDSIGFMGHLNKDGLSTAVADIKHTLGLAEVDLMLQFAEKIGKGYADEELALCRYAYTKMNESAEKLRDELKNKEKLYRTIPPMLALSVILILI